MKKLKVLVDMVWYSAPGGARKLQPGDIIEVPPSLDDPTVNSWVAHNLVEAVK